MNCSHILPWCQVLVATEHTLFPQWKNIMEWWKLFKSVLHESKFNLAVKLYISEWLLSRCVKKFEVGDLCGMFTSADVGPLIGLSGKVNAAVHKNIIEQNVVPSLKAPPVNEVVYMWDIALIILQKQ